MWKNVPEISQKKFFSSSILGGWNHSHGRARSKSGPAHHSLIWTGLKSFMKKNKFYPQQNCSALNRCQFLHLYCFVIAVWIFLKTVIKWIPLKLDQTSLEMPKQSSWHSFALFFLLTPKSLPPLTSGLQDLGREGEADRENLHVSLVNNFLFILFLTAIMFYLERNVVGKNCIQGNQAGLFHFTPAMFVFLSVVCEILM